MLLTTLHNYMKEYDIAGGLYVQRSEIFSFYSADTDFMHYVWVPEVSSVHLNTQVTVVVDTYCRSLTVLEIMATAWRKNDDELYTTIFVTATCEIMAIG